MNKSQIENIAVSYFPSKESKSSAELTIGEVLTSIKCGKYEHVISTIRSHTLNGKVDEAKELKGTLPAVTFSGLYPEFRRDGYCTCYNSIIVIDIDKLSVEQMTLVREQLIADKYVTALWTSPSGNGYKGLVNLHYDKSFDDISIHDKHRTAFRALYRYMLASYGVGLDRSGSDPTRLCFMSYDPNLVIKESADEFLVEFEETPSISSSQPDRANAKIRLPRQKAYKKCDWNKLIGQKWEYKDYEQNKQTLYSIFRKMKRKNISITSTFEEWVKVAYAIANSMHPAFGKEMFMKMCELDGANHDPYKSEHLLYDAYCNNKGNVHFSTIIYMATQKGVIGLV